MREVRGSSPLSSTMTAPNTVYQTPTDTGYKNLDPTQDKSLYNSGWLTVFTRNFVAGASRALGAMFVYFIFLGVMMFVVTTFIYPSIEPLISAFVDLSKMQQQLPSNSLQMDPQELLRQIGQ